MTTYTASANRRGFTLAEMLVVIAIILILAAILVPTVVRVLSITEEVAIAIEIGQLDAAMQQYKLHMDSFPPHSDPSATAAEPQLVAHVQSQFRGANVVMPYGMDAGEALVFWLQGFSSSPLDPLGGEREALFQFDQTRLKPTRVVNGIPLFHYVPTKGQGQPYVYFHHAGYATASYTAAAPGVGTVRPYKSSISANPYINPRSFQIISAGLDGDYGGDNADKQFPAGLNYDAGDRDNITNFCGGTLGNKVQ